MKKLLDLIAKLFGKKALSQTLGTRTNVISLTNKKLEKYITNELNIEEASDAAAINALKEMENLVVDIPKMNDLERLIYTGNLQRTKNKLQASGLIEPDETAEIFSAATKEPVSKEGIEQLLKESGQQNPSGSLMERILSKINKIKLEAEKLKESGSPKTAGDLLEDFSRMQQLQTRRGREGLIRSIARQIMYSDIKSGKFKFPKEVEDIVLGREAPNKAADPVDFFRNYYGEDALQQLDSIHSELAQQGTELNAEKLARSQFEFTPKLGRPKESFTDAEVEAMLKEDFERGTSPLLKGPDRYIIKPKDEATEVKPKGEIIPFKKKDDPDKFARGGSAGLDYLMGMEGSYATGGRVNYAIGAGGDMGAKSKTQKETPYRDRIVRIVDDYQKGDLPYTQKKLGENFQKNLYESVTPPSMSPIVRGGLNMLVPFLGYGLEYLSKKNYSPFGYNQITTSPVNTMTGEGGGGRDQDLGYMGYPSYEAYLAAQNNQLNTNNEVMELYNLYRSRIGQAKGGLGYLVGE